MTVHLIKLCVGVETVNELADWQDERLKRLKREKKTPELCHRTLQTPRRRDEVLDGGSLYWVIKGFVLVRQRMHRSQGRYEGGRHGVLRHRARLRACRHASRIRAAPSKAGAISKRPTRRETPRDFADSADAMPPGMREELRELRLIDW